MDRSVKCIVLSTLSTLFFAVFLQFVVLPYYLSHLSDSSVMSISPSTNKNSVPRLAYLLSGSAGDVERLERILQAIYHPHNVYIVHLDTAASPVEHRQLFDYIGSHAVFSDIGNVKMVENPDRVSENGPTKVASVLHAAAILLDEGGEWDWFINLDASSYPLVIQDDLLFVLSQLPRHLNFINRISQYWKQGPDRSQIILDEGLYKKEGIISLPGKRGLPMHFDLFFGSPWMGLTHSFVKYCILGWDNLPRTLLLYHANSFSSAESYFQTVICNARRFRKTTVDTDLHFTVQDDPHQHQPRSISMDDYELMVKSNAPFARKFFEPYSEDVLDWIDRNLLFRGPNMLVPGGWCAGEKLTQRLNGTISSSDGCLTVGSMTNIQPGPGARRLQKFFDQLVYNNGSVSSLQCEVEL